MKENSSIVKIGVMDSGMGGLTVLNDLTEHISEADYLYYGDIANSPYGTKSSEEVLNFTEEIIKFFISKDVSAVVIACNTATSAAINHLRNTYPIPIFGMEPAIKPALLENPNKKIAVLATSLTLREEKFNKLERAIGFQNSLVLFNCDGLATLIDKEDISGAANFLDPIISELEKNNVDTIVLGCTHYILLKPILLSRNSSLKIYDGNLGTVRHVKKTLMLPSKERESKLDIYINGGTEEHFEIAYRYLNTKTKDETKYVR
jgi:glutamate racemase